MKKMIALLSAAMLLLTLVTGCSSNEKPAAETDKEAASEKTENAESKQEPAEDSYDVIRFGHAYDATTLDPQNCYDDGSYYILNNICEGLVVGYDNEIHPGIAETWDVNEDGTVYTFHLRQSTWSDGTPLTAHDFVYSAKRVLDPNMAYENAYTFYSLKNGEAYNLGECDFEEVGVKALNDYTVEYTLENPSAIALYMFSSYVFAPVNQAACEQYGETYGAEANTILTNGPFTCTEWLHESKITIQKNENYWNADNVKIDEVQFIIGASSQVGVDLFMANELDVGIFTGNTSINALNMLGLNSETKLSGSNFVHMNCSGGSEASARFMSNANFRKAISCAISREDIMRVGDIVGIPAHRISAPTLTVADGRTWDEAYPLTGWSTTAEPEKAKEYLNLALEELGATVEEIPTLVMVCFDSQSNLDRLQAMQDMLYQTLGINCEISPQPIQQMFELVDNGQFDFWTGGKTVEVPDWLDQIAYEYSTEPGSIGYYNNPEYDALYDQAGKTASMEERNELVFQLEQMIVDEMTTLHLYWNEDYTFMVPSLTGLKECNGYGPYFALCDYAE